MFIGFLRTFADLLFQILIFAIIARALLSWFPVRPGNPFYALMVVLLQITEPILAPRQRDNPRGCTAYSRSDELIEVTRVPGPSRDAGRPARRHPLLGLRRRYGA